MTHHDTMPIDDLENIAVSDRASLEPGEGIACLLTTSSFDQVWMRCGTVTAVSDDGTLIVYQDQATTSRGTTQWLDPTDWVARWPQ